MLNDNLSWKSHCDKIANNISKAVGGLNRLKHFLPEAIKIFLYNSIIVSDINYCIWAWGYLCTLKKKIEHDTNTGSWRNVFYSETK